MAVRTLAKKSCPNLRSSVRGRPQAYQPSAHRARSGHRRTVKIPARTRLHFTPAKALKDQVLGVTTAAAKAKSSAKASQSQSNGQEEVGQR